ncbi:uncharacterized protein PG986_000171 [Apiospora aurea]|uniref:Uncharacterized protein n=1 Tax=Apiospora aurea TaxID=335848 RepID=A0ABR1QTG8_9PEZI
MAHRPRDHFTPKVFARLGQALWSWDPCKECLDKDDSKASSSCECPVDRAKRYFRFYQGLVLDYYSACISPIFKSHNDLFRAITQLRANPKLTRNELLECVAPTCSDVDEQASATALVVRIAVMLECFTIYQSADRLEDGLSGIPWRDNTSISTHIAEAFSGQVSVTPQSLLCYSDLRRGSKSTLRATKLRKRLKLRLRPTHDLRNHLRLDRQRGELEIFHHAAFLKEQLWATSHKHHNEGSNALAAIPPLLPRQLLLEALDSLQRVLFPLDDADSKRLLRRLIKSPDSAFDPSLLQFEYSSLLDHSIAAAQRDEEGKSSSNDPEVGGVHYRYWAARLAELREELENPPPRRWLDRQLQRRSSARYVVMVTLAGVVFAVLSLIMSAIQTWVAYPAWKAPNDPNAT